MTQPGLGTCGHRWLAPTGVQRYLYHYMGAGMSTCRARYRRMLVGYYVAVKSQVYDKIAMAFASISVALFYFALFYSAASNLFITVRIALLLFGNKYILCSSSLYLLRVHAACGNLSWGHCTDYACHSAKNWHVILNSFFQPRETGAGLNDAMLKKKKLLSIEFINHGIYRI